VEVSVPLGDFAKDDYNLEQYGMADIGMVLSVQFQFPIGQRWGMNVRLMHSAWFTDPSALEKIIEERDGKASAGVNGWTSTAFLVGPYGLLPLNRNNTLIFYYRILIGAAYSTSPDFEINSGMNYENENVINGGSGTDPAVQVGIDLRYDFSNFLSFLTFASYYYTNTTVDGIENSMEPGLNPLSITMPIMAFNFGIGLGLILNGQRVR